MATRRFTTVADVLGASQMLASKMGHIGPREWAVAVGERLSKMTFPEQLEDESLVVRVPSSTWAQELSLLAPTIVENLRSRGHAVRRLRFRVASPHESAGKATKSVPVTRAARARLPPALASQLQAMDDRELAAAIAEAAAWSLGRRS